MENRSCRATTDIYRRSVRTRGYRSLCATDVRCGGEFDSAIGADSHARERHAHVGSVAAHTRQRVDNIGALLADAVAGETSDEVPNPGTADWFFALVW
jgi:hypothetical protein